ncbi:lysophospholipid acyltransferase family protein [uncultured Umboniibacter sp.]|uniref:lysophospholipid acyltransferase family protein n=1 Tax=uncultured Umboniibacter sp. TaxID=1798917 RepID=UPI00260DD83A|nr:lysophospholipid acyltransferase family protein [uncultured Umboniibacter sp.]
MGVFIVKLLSYIPLAVSYRSLSPLLSFLLYRVFKYRVKVSRENLARVYPEKTAQEREVILREYYQFLGDMFVEILRSPHLSAEDFLARVKWDNPEVVNDLWAEGKSIVGVALHQCNWEWMLHSAALTLDPPLEIIYKPLHNKAFDTYFRETRARFGSTLVPHKKAVQIFHYRKDQFFLILLADQAPLKKRKKVWAKMLGQDTAFPLGAELFAMKNDAVVVYGWPRRVSRGHYQIRLEILAEPPFKNDENEILKAYAKRGGEAIMAQPETWLWSNRRWSYSKSEDPTLSNEEDQ